MKKILYFGNSKRLKHCFETYVNDSCCTAFEVYPISGKVTAEKLVFLPEGIDAIAICSNNIEEIEMIVCNFQGLNFPTYIWTDEHTAHELCLPGGWKTVKSRRYIPACLNECLIHHAPNSIFFN